MISPQFRFRVFGFAGTEAIGRRAGVAAAAASGRMMLEGEYQRGAGAETQKIYTVTRTGIETENMVILEIIQGTWRGAARRNVTAMTAGSGAARGTGGAAGVEKGGGELMAVRLTSKAASKRARIVH